MPSEDGKFQVRSGAGWVIAQVALFCVYALVPIQSPWDAPMWLRAVGLADMAFGFWLAGDAFWRLGRFLSPFPRPVPGGPLHQSGSFRIVRHPIYAGLVFAAWGWAWVAADVNRLLVSVVLFAFFNAKATVEERWLAAHHPGYAAYCVNVSKLIPWLW